MGARLIPLLLALGACTPPSPPSVLLVTLDTTRADALGVYGQAPSPTPHLDALAARGWVADEVVAPAPMTLPSHASLLTGLDADVHGVRDNLGYALPDGLPTLAERFRSAGYATGAFVAAVVLDDTFGLDRGFDHYDAPFDLTATGADLGIAHRRGDAVRRAAEAWIADQDGPFFAWVHFYDAHRPWEAPEGAFTGYLAEVAFVDAQVGALIDGFDGIVAVVGDHGEGNGDHGELTHGQLAYRSTLRVPLVLAGPGVPVGRTDVPVAVTDLATTLPRLVGLPPVGPGQDLRAPTPRTLYAETWFPRRNLGLHDLRVAQDGTWRLVRGARDELFAWREDPGELRDVHADHPDVVARLGAFLDDRPAAVSAPVQVSADLQRALESLGYLSGTPSLVSGPLPDPRDHPDMAVALEEVVIAARTRPPGEGARILESFLAEYPAVGAARQLLATAHEKAGDPERALAALQPLVDARPGDVPLRTRRAELLLAAGRAEEAEAALRGILAETDAIGPTAVLAEILRRTDRCDEAVALADTALAGDPGASRLLLVRGACHRSAGRLAAAESDLAAAARLDPANPDVHYVLGLVLAERGRPDDAAVAFARQLDLTPDALPAAAALGAARYAAGRHHAAIDPLERALADPTDAESRILLADALLRTGADPRRPLRLLDDAAALAPTDPRIPEIRAAALLAAGDPEAAIRAMEGALR